jgi:hypothetical protein
MKGERGVEKGEARVEVGVKKRTGGVPGTAEQG